MAAPALRRRWTSPDGLARAREAIARLRTGGSLRDAAFGEWNGRYDLRGLGPLTSDDSAVMVDKAALVDIDLSGADLRHLRLMRSRIENCRFDSARLSDLRLWATDVVETSFSGADLRYSVLGTWHKGRDNGFEAVDFSGSNLTRIVCSHARFDLCDFSSARLSQIDFEADFTRCTFKGTLKNVTFYGGSFRDPVGRRFRFDDIDLRDADLHWVDFRSLDMDRVALPNDEDHLVIEPYRCTLEHALRELSEAPDPPLEALLRHDLKWAGQRQKRGVVSRSDLTFATRSEDPEYAFALLRRAMSACADAGTAGPPNPSE